MNRCIFAGLTTISLAACSLTACGGSGKAEATGASPGVGGSTETASTGAGLGGAGGEGGAPNMRSSSSASSASGTSTSTASSSSGKTTTTTSSSSSGGTTTTSSSSSGGTTDLTIYATPATSIPTVISNAIMAATTSVHMTMYILDYTPYIDALLDRKKAGLDVRVILNQNFPTGTVETNPATYTTLTNAGIGVVWRNGPPTESGAQYTHEKTFILDGKQAWIMTMNMDASAAKYNREYIVVDNAPADVAEADAIFLDDYAGTGNSDGAPLVVSPTNSRSSVVALINASTKTLDVEVEEFSDTQSNGVVAAVAAAAKRGVATRVILANATPSSSQTTAINTVKAAGAKVVVSGGTSGSSSASKPYIHAKAITIDCNGNTCAKGFIGSENFTASSLSYNRELGLIVENATELAVVQAAINIDFAAGTAQ